MRLGIAGNVTGLVDALALGTPQAQAPKAMLVEDCSQTCFPRSVMLDFNSGSCATWSGFGSMRWTAACETRKENYQERCMDLCKDRSGVGVSRRERWTSSRVCFGGRERGKQDRRSSSTFNAWNGTQRRMKGRTMTRDGN